jgi:hypothetical protein
MIAIWLEVDLLRRAGQCTICDGNGRLLDQVRLGGLNTIGGGYSVLFWV